MDNTALAQARERERELERERQLERERCIDVIRSHMDGVNIDTHRMLMRIINVLKGPPGSQPPRPDILETRIEEISVHFGPDQLASMLRRVVGKMGDEETWWSGSHAS